MANWVRKKEGLTSKGGERRRRERGKGRLMYHEDSRHAMTEHAEQFGLEEEEEERQRKGGRRQMGKLAWCQRYQGMMMQDKTSPDSLTLVASCCLCVRIMSEHKAGDF